MAKEQDKERLRERERDQCYGVRVMESLESPSWGAAASGQLRSVYCRQGRQYMAGVAGASQQTAWLCGSTMMNLRSSAKCWPLVERTAPTGQDQEGVN